MHYRAIFAFIFRRRISKWERKSKPVFSNPSKRKGSSNPSVLGLFGRVRGESCAFPFRPSSRDETKDTEEVLDWGRDATGIIGIGFKSATPRCHRETKTFIIRERGRLFVFPAFARIAFAPREPGTVKIEAYRLPARDDIFFSRLIHA